MAKLDDLQIKISEKKKMIISFSGGVDSGLLAKIATDVLGEDAICVILDSETLPRNELKNAEKLARSLNFNLEIAQISLLADKEFAENSPHRCYFCKKASSRALKKIAAERDIECIADGLNLSDFNEYRPGISASDEEGIWHPFVEAGFFKEEIREIARIMCLTFWNKPSSPCLSSRIPYSERITRENLMMVETAENYLISCGLRQLRVRAHGRLARIESLKEDHEKVLSKSHDVTAIFRSIGFDYVTLDLEGFRSGSMNDALVRKN